MDLEFQEMVCKLLIKISIRLGIPAYDPDLVDVQEWLASLGIE